MSKFGEWVEVKIRSLTDEEKRIYNDEFNYMFDCELPEDGQEVLITSKHGNVDKTTFYSDFGSYFEYYEDEGDVIAWMPLPEGYVKEKEFTLDDAIERYKTLAERSNIIAINSKMNNRIKKEYMQISNWLKEYKKIIELK